MIEDPLTGDFPSRNEIEEEEEAAVAANLPIQYTIKPTIQAESASHSPTTLVIALGSAACIAAEAALASSAQPAGSIAVPELKRIRSPLEVDQGTGRPTEHACTLLHDAERSTLIASCPKTLAPEQAVTWTEAVLAELAPERVVVASSMLAMDYRGPGDPSEESLVFSLRTSAAEVLRDSVPVLPPATLLSGLPAALLQEMEGLGRPAIALVVVENSPVPDSGLVCKLVDAMCGALGREFIDAEVRAAVANAVANQYRTSASNSMFI